ncbi:MAG: T9SS type A sorting domain-containing protein [Bacteroidales bacterium]|nr:T9SS type A sorting domain-containing protein [Bacteroidales bacterium]
MKKFLLLGACVLCLFSVVAQETVTLTFTAKQENNAYQQLDSVMVSNVTRGWTEMLYYPDTILSMNVVGITNYQDKKVRLHQNVPNPFHGVTDFNLTLAENGKVNLTIFDINGKQVAEYHNTLPSGEHLFRATMSSPQTYLLSAMTKNGNTAIKMINLSNTGEPARIEYISSTPLTQNIFKKQSNNEFAKGDDMKYVGYATQKAGVKEVTITQTQQNSETIVFTFPNEEVEPEHIVAVTTQEATNITFSSAKLNGEYTVQNDTITQVGFWWKAEADEVWKEQPCDQVNTTFAYYISDLSAGTKYMFKAYAQTVDSMYAGEELNFTTPLPREPIVVTDSASQVGYASATVHGHFAKADEDIEKQGFILLKETEVIDNCEISDLEVTTPFKCDFSGLESEASYKFAAYVTTASGTYYGDTLIFTTLKYVAPTVTTDSAQLFTATSVILYGSFVEGTVPASEIGFRFKKRYGQSITEVALSSIETPFSKILSNLDEATEYAYNAYVRYDGKIVLGEEKYFTTSSIPNCGTLTDVDGNRYKTVIIAGRCWMRENIKVRHFADGTEIKEDARSNITATTDFYYRNVYGNLYYSAYTAARGTFCAGNAEYSNIQGICPDGWHLPSNYEWARVEEAAGMPWSEAKQYRTSGGGSNRGNIARALIASPDAWDETDVINAPGNRSMENTVVAGISAFDIEPLGGCGPGNLDASNVGKEANFWTASGLWRIIKYNEATISAGAWSNESRDQYSIRCVKDLDPVIPTVSIQSPATPQYKEVAVEGKIEDEGFAVITEKGFCYSTSNPQPDITDSKFVCEASGNAFTAHITGLLPNTLYYVRAFATNAAGTGYSDTLSFSTTALPDLPTIETRAPENVLQTSAVLNGLLRRNGGDDIAEMGFCLSKDVAEPTMEDQKVLLDSPVIGKFSVAVEDLTPGTTYYVRAFATNTAGTAYGDVVPMTTQEGEFACGDNITDVEGNVYGTIQIGTQCWMTGNMRATKYDTESEGSGEIPVMEVKDLAEMFNPSYKENAGKYYYNYAAALGFATGEEAINYTTVSGPRQGICPNGWHVGTLEEWCTLEGFVTNTTVNPIISGDKVATGFFKALSGTGAYSAFNITRDGQYKYNGTADGLTTSTFMMYATPLPEDYSASLTDLTEDYNQPKYYNAKYWGDTRWGWDNCAQNSTTPKCNNMAVRCLKTQTTPLLPIIKTEAATEVTQTSALLHGTLMTDGGAAITEIGFCLSKDVAEPTVENQKVLVETPVTGAFDATVEELELATTYYVRAFATNEAGTAYGDVITMTTKGEDFNCGDDVVDVNGNTYGSIQIGTQCWMTGNMRATKYDTESEGSGEIPVMEVRDLHEMFHPSYKENGGKYYYNYAAALGFGSGDEAIEYTTASGPRQGICPNGWHVGTLEEWCTLEGFVTGTTVNPIISGDKVANGFFKALSGSGTYGQFNLTRDGSYKADGTLDSPTTATFMMYATPLPEDYSSALTELSDADYNKPQYYHAKYWGDTRWGWDNCAQNSAVPKCYSMAVRCIHN